MATRVLESVDVPATMRPRLSVDDAYGYTQILCNGDVIDSDSQDELVRSAKFALDAQPRGKSVAWIGGGICHGPRLFAIADCKQTVYEIEPALAEFCPEGVTFIPGDYRDTLTGTYDVIIYDLGGAVPVELLSRHLKRGGVILPKEDR